MNEDKIADLIERLLGEPGSEEEAPLRRQAAAALESLRAENERLREAAAAIIADWDSQCIEREKYIEPCGEMPGYWTPHSAMVHSVAIAGLRTALKDMP